MWNVSKLKEFLAAKSKTLTYDYIDYSYYSAIGSDIYSTNSKLLE